MKKHKFISPFLMQNKLKKIKNLISKSDFGFLKVNDYNRKESMMKNRFFNCFTSRNKSNSDKRETELSTYFHKFYLQLYRDKKIK